MKKSSKIGLTLLLSLTLSACATTPNTSSVSSNNKVLDSIQDDIIANCNPATTDCQKLKSDINRSRKFSNTLDLVDTALVNTALLLSNLF